MTEALSHYTVQPVTAFYSVYSVTQSDQPAMKPHGLWVSVDGPDGWPAWCRKEQFVDIDAQHRYRITLTARAEILRLSSPADLEAFKRSYGEPDGLIRWADVAAKWAGIIIAPYQWQVRYAIDSLWYYGWDCASGCIWDASAIASVTEVTAQPAEPAAVS